MLNTQPGARVALGMAAMMTAVTVAGCALPTIGESEKKTIGGDTPPELAGLPLSRGTDPAQARAATKLLQIDPCAVLDPAAAEQATGQEGDAIVPGRAITACELTTEDPADSANYTSFDLKVDTYAQVQKASAAPLQLPGGVTLYKTNLGETGGCAYDYDLGQGYALTLQVARYGTGEGRSCEVGDAFVRAIAPEIAEPPTRDQGRTTPAMPVVSPCVAIGEALNTVPPLPGAQTDADHQAEVAYTEPSKCEVRDYLPGESISTTLMPKRRVLVAVEVDTDPQLAASEGLREPVTVANRNGSVRPPDPMDSDSRCEITVRLTDDTIEVDEDSPGSEVVAPVLRVQALTCDQAKSVTASTLRAAKV